MDKSVRYSNLVDAKTRNALVLKDGVIFNNKYEGSAKAGAVKVRKSGAATIQKYDPANGVSLTSGDSEWITVDIDQDYAVNEIVDGFDAAAIPDGVIADRLDEAGYGMANRLDVDGAIELMSAGTPLTSTAALSKSTVYDALVDADTALTTAGVPRDNRRYVIVTPTVFALIRKSPEFIAASALGDEVKTTGAVGAIAGLNVYESNNIGSYEDEEENTVNVEFVAGHPDYATRVNEWAVDVHVQDLNGSGKYIGASAIQGRKVYGHKVSNPACILVKTKA